MSLLETYLEHEIKAGYYHTKIRYYREHNPKDRQPFILVEMEIDGLIVKDRWYANRIPSIMRALRSQYRMDYMDVTLSQLLKHASNNEFLVEIYYDGYYGRQINYIVD